MKRQSQQTTMTAGYKILKVLPFKQHQKKKNFKIFPTMSNLNKFFRRK